MKKCLLILLFFALPASAKNTYELYHPIVHEVSDLPILVAPLIFAQTHIFCPLDGACTWTSINTFSAGVLAANINNVQYANQFAGADASIKTNACIAQVISSGGGICDASGLIGPQTISTEIDVGNHSQVPVTLRLPQASTWTVSGITNGTSCALKMFSQSSILGPGTAGSSAMVIHGGVNTNNLDSLLCTEASPVGNGSYVRAEGFQLYNQNGATMANGSMNIQATFDDAEFKDIVVASYGTVGINIHGIVCCGTNFTNVTSNANHVANSIPVQITGGAPGPVGLAFYNLSADHPGSGKNAIVLSSVGNDNGIRFYNTYSEGNNADNTTPNISAGSTAGPIEFYGLTCNDKAGSTAYCVDMPNPGSGQAALHIYGMHQLVGGSSNCVNDHYTPRTVACDANGNMSMYVTGNSNMTELTSQIFQSSSVNPAASGQYRLASTDTFAWRNNANSSDVTLSKNTSDNLIWPNIIVATGGFQGDHLASNSANTAQTGIVRLASTDTIAWRNNANSADLALSKNTSDNLVWPNTVGSLNGVATTGQGIPLIVAKADQTGQTANISLVTLYAVPAAQGGMYRLSCYIVLTTVAGTSSTMPGCVFEATDVDAGGNLCASSCQFTSTNNSNLTSVTNSANAASQGLNSGTVIINAKASTNIQYGTTGYASNPAATMQYAVHVKLEYLGT